MSLSRAGFWSIALGVVAFVGVAIRVSNAFVYPVNLGFDAPENWRYIHQLTHDWELPKPDADWSSAHPPFFYYVSAALASLDEMHSADPAVIHVRLLGTTLGLLGIALCVWLVHRVSPNEPRRSWLAAALLLFLPVQIYMSAMLNEEVWGSFLITVVVVGTASELQRRQPTRGARALARAAGLGLAGGLALLTKLSGVLVLGAAGGAAVLAGWKRRTLPSALTWSAVLVTVGLLVGGWFYARNWVYFGTLYPQDLAVHEVMFTMPPGERDLGDYLYVPVSTWTDPQLTDPDLLRSVWGSTYVTLWFDGHRHFLARESPRVTRAGTWILLLALLPTGAFFVGLWRGVRRAWADPVGPDTPLLLLTALTLAGYVAFTLGNPWFASVKASYLLGLIAPFSFYASEVLADWTRTSGPRATCVWVTLGLLFVAIVVVFTYGPVYWNWAGRGVEWNPIPSLNP
ncbi:MAG: hypothetical protein VX574_07990 [Myxococcota bacterium]|nr:hypothetical protein [Myxococcota bacterium]